MADVILTGASRGIGHALATRLAADHRLFLVSRTPPKIGGDSVAITADLSSRAEARAAGERVAQLVAPGATLIHNAGIWPHKRVLTAEGLEAGFATNCAGPLAFQQPLLGVVERILVIGAGIMIKGRFDADRTPTGADFSGFRTYADTKLAFAVAMRDVAAQHPDLDVLVVHPGVVRTDLGNRPGPMGWLLSLIKRSWEQPEDTAARLVRILGRGRWSAPGNASWFVEEEKQPWPAVADDAKTREAVRAALARLTS
ncbi:MAG TPA: SDR family NAD(P)-dependent oxidoreductase [Thermoanaerobaculia bacterium]